MKCVFHHDIKSSNVLLDEDFNPCLGDFGLPRLTDHHKFGKTTLMAGTLGYMDPGMHYISRASRESDVKESRALLDLGALTCKSQTSCCTLSLAPSACMIPPKASVTKPRIRNNLRYSKMSKGSYMPPPPQTHLSWTIGVPRGSGACNRLCCKSLELPPPPPTPYECLCQPSTLFLGLCVGNPLISRNTTTNCP